MLTDSGTNAMSDNQQSAMLYPMMLMPDQRVFTNWKKLFKIFLA
jgi:tryptophanase